MVGVESWHIRAFLCALRYATKCASDGPPGGECAKKGDGPTSSGFGSGTEGHSAAGATAPDGSEGLRIRIRMRVCEGVCGGIACAGAIGIPHLSSGTGTGGEARRIGAGAYISTGSGPHGHAGGV